MAENPFEVTKAVDFTDAEIAATWVDLPGGGFASLADPRSPMPTFLVGGKGGGRTHLLRYFSFALQRLRGAADVLGGVQREGYVGIYFRCAGLNSSRFEGKRQDVDTWGAVFSYYTELWLARLTLDVVAEICRGAGDRVSTDELASLRSAIVNLFDTHLDLPVSESSDLHALTGVLRQSQRELDIAINNAALSHNLDIRIGASPGRLVFGIPAAVTKHVGALAGLTFAYLLDEFENLTADQQRYVNTLVREKELPTTFLIGSRLFGLRTHATLAADEENRQGSEFSQVVLEEAYRAQSHSYRTFCTEIVRRRLAESGFEITKRTRLQDFFEQPHGDTASVEKRAAEVLLHHQVGHRPWLNRLNQQLVAAGLGNSADSITAAVSVDDSPLHEKFAILLLYRAWADGENLGPAAKRIAHDVAQLRSMQETAGKLQTSYKHYRLDLYAQILADLRLPQEYVGLDDFIRMSGFLPRNLLVVLKQVTQWSLFQGETPFRGGVISLRAQREGVREASNWFLSDAKGLGRVGEEAQLAIRRLASLFREMRFADKPVEVSCSAFSTDRQGLTPGALASLDEALSHSLLLEVPVGRRDRNSHVLQHKYQLNPMLAPLFDLSLALRGTASFSRDELNAIFDGERSDDYEGVRRRIVGRMQAPFTKAPQDRLDFS